MAYADDCFILQKSTRKSRESIGLLTDKEAWKGFQTELNQHIFIDMKAKAIWVWAFVQG